MSGCLRFITPIAFLRRYDYEFIWISFSLIVSLLFMYRCTMFACAHIAVIKTRANNREIQPYTAEKVFLFLETRFASVPCKILRDDSSPSDYLSRRIASWRTWHTLLLFRVSDPKPYPVLLICAYLTRAGWKNSRSEKTR